MIPSYIYPSLWVPTNPWNFGLEYAAGGIAVLNPNSGNFVAVDPYQLTALTNAQKAGVTMIGYISTNYGNRPLSQLQNNVDLYLSLYSSIDGFFLDEGATSSATLPIYSAISNYIRQAAASRGKPLTIVINPGTVPDQGYFSVADVVIIFENSLDAFVASYVTPTYQAQISSAQLAAVIYGVTTSAEVKNALALTRQRNIGNVYLANDNSYSSISSFIYQQAGIIEACGIVDPCVLSGAFKWLHAQQHSSGLVQSYEGFLTDNAYSYDQALFAIALMLNATSTTSSNFVAAQKLLTFLHEGLVALNGASSAWAVPFVWSISGGTPVGNFYSHIFSVFL